MTSPADSPRRLTDLEVLCEDGPVIAVNKRPGIIVQGAPAGVENLADLVRAYLKDKYAKPGNVYLGVPHRLDRPVSGVVVFSRNSKCAARLSEQFANRDVRKIYRAIVERPPDPPAGEMTDWLLRVSTAGPAEEATEDARAPKVAVVDPETPEAKRAVLRYRTLATAHGRALVEIELETGRMHQIRVQFSSRGRPLPADRPAGVAADSQASGPLRRTHHHRPASGGLGPAGVCFRGRDRSLNRRRQRSAVRNAMRGSFRITPPSAAAPLPRPVSPPGRRSFARALLPRRPPPASAAARPR